MVLVIAHWPSAPSRVPNMLWRLRYATKIKLVRYTVLGSQVIFVTGKVINCIFGPSNAELVVITTGTGTSHPGWIQPGRKYPRVVNYTQVSQHIMWSLSNKDGGRWRQNKNCNNWANILHGDLKSPAKMQMVVRIVRWKFERNSSSRSWVIAIQFFLDVCIISLSSKITREFISGCHWPLLGASDLV